MNVLLHTGIALFIVAVHAFAQDAPVLLFVSDSQQPLWIETVRLAEHDNEQATQQLFRFMSRESAAAAFHLGDITAVGMLDRYWYSFDTLRTLLPFPLHAAFGNHEYFFIPSWGKEQMLKRFPDLEPSWYRKRFGSTAVIVLNSNFDRLSDTETVQQNMWYQAALDELENDSTVSAVIVACHHSPYTNSTIVSPNEDVQRNFVRPFVQSKKGAAFISGHAHTREHFRLNGKDFLVIGGGGGLRQPLRDTLDAGWIGERHIPRQGFHYLRCELRPRSLHAQIRMLNEDLGSIETVEEVTIRTSWPDTAASARIR